MPKHRPALFLPTRLLFAHPPAAQQPSPGASVAVVLSPVPPDSSPSCVLHLSPHAQALSAPRLHRSSPTFDHFRHIELLDLLLPTT